MEIPSGIQEMINLFYSLYPHFLICTTLALNYKTIFSLFFIPPYLLFAIIY